MLKISKKFYTLAVPLVFLGAAILHGYRFIMGFPLMYGDWLVPLWVSGLAMLIAFLLALSGIKRLR